MDDTPSDKTKIIKFILKFIAIDFLILSIILIVFGLMPHEKIVVNNKPLQPVEIACSHAIELDKGEILVIDYVVQGKDVAFYLTYGDPWQEGNYAYLVKRDHAGNDHIELDAEKSGFYYLNFESNDPSTTGTFSVDLSYKIMDRYSPMYVILGGTSLSFGVLFTILYLWLKKKSAGDEEDEYIRI
ncbi:MAG: hypothetical protein JSV56_08645 [Methanomassiliicoccales archaeon]|nr:MAG: hypothetical protein JSV56_08645 [Methanomassiliicoccales archaeon]